MRLRLRRAASSNSLSDVTAALPQENPATGTMATTPACQPRFRLTPAMTCSGNPLDPTTINSSLYINYFRAAWYKLATTTAGTVIADTKGSSYDTRVMVVTGIR